MLHLKSAACVALMLLAGTPNFAQQAKTRVACMGNSITYGAGIANEADKYPAQLQKLLGDKYEVKNFGQNSQTVQMRGYDLLEGSQPGDCAYRNKDTYKAALAYKPDIVVIKLGTNDSKRINWRDDSPEVFRRDLNTMLDELTANSHPKIYMCYPLRVVKEDWTINEPNLHAIIDILKSVAEERGLNIINLHTAFEEALGCRWNTVYNDGDGVHPNGEGAGIMARRIADAILHGRGGDADNYKCHDTKVTLDDVKQLTPFDFHGFRGYDFAYKGAAMRVVVPEKEAKGRPWILRARFWGHEPQTDIALLERGWHVAYCDVADLYGSPAAVARWNLLYEWMTANGMSDKAVLEGMSRGGLIVYNWAAQNPDRVAAIYADAPVMDFKSWPMGCGASAGSPDDAAKLLRAYGFGSETEARAWNGNPKDHAEAIARAKIPCLHVVGDADTDVPVDENTAVFEREMKALKWPITVIHKPGVGHHPHSLKDPAPIVEFIVKKMKK